MNQNLFNTLKSLFDVDALLSEMDEIKKAVEKDELFGVYEITKELETLHFLLKEEAHDLKEAAFAENQSLQWLELGYWHSDLLERIDELKTIINRLPEPPKNKES